VAFPSTLRFFYTLRLFVSGNAVKADPFVGVIFALRDFTQLQLQLTSTRPFKKAVDNVLLFYLVCFASDKTF
jgi:hypothetical protein